MKRKYFAIIVAALTLLSLGACVTATPYKPAGDDPFGYKSQKLENDKYRVSFSGNSKTDRDTVSTYLLYRAAELTLAQGGDYFIVANQDTQRNVQQTATYVGSPFFFGPGFFGSGTAATNSTSEYEAYGTISIQRGNKPADNPMAYDARQVESNLQSQIKRPE